MKRVALMMTVLALAMGCDDNNTPPAGPSNTGPIVFTAQLSAANEVPAITGAEANARGSVTITFNVPRDSAGNPTGGGPVTFSVQLNGFPANTPAVAAHIHPGAAGINGSPLVGTNLTAASPVLMGDGTANVTLSGNPPDVSQANAAAVMANPGGYYFNVHTQLNPGGAVRGQLTRTQ